MPKKSKILTLTMNPTLDVSGSIDTMVPDKKLRCTEVRKEPGGGGINVSRAIAILGGSSRALVVGGGRTAQFVKKKIDAEGVETQLIDSPAMFRHSLAVHDQQENHQYRFALPGEAVEDHVWQKCLQTIAESAPAAEYLVLSGSLPPGVPDDFYRRVCQQLQKSTIKIVLDTSGDPLKVALGENIFLIKPNLRELRGLCRQSVDTREDQEKVCRNLVNKGKCQIVALTLGKDGALLTSPDMQFRIPGIDVEPKSSVGAGDSFVGAMTLALAQGRSLQDAFSYGMAAGTAALKTPGTELCHQADTDDLYRMLQEKYT